MTFETGSALDVEDLLSKLDTFADVTHGGWNSDYTSNPQTTDGWFSLTKGSCSVSIKFPVGGQGPPEHISLHQATGFVGQSTAPGKHTADSGNGYNAGDTGHTNANLLTERCVRDIGNGPFPSYFFFADDTAPHDYIHVIVEVSTGLFRHFGFGDKIEKFGDNWVGGQYVFGHYHDTATNAPATDTNHNCLWDGLATNENRSATMRIASGLLNQGAAVYGVFRPGAPSQTDTAGNVRRRIHGGFRAGIEARGFGNPVGNSSAGVIPLYSIGAYYRDPSNPRVQLLGYLPDIRAFNIRNFEAKQEITIDGDTWVLFPFSIKTTAAVANRSLFSGIAYRKVV